MIRVIYNMVFLLFILHLSESISCNPYQCAPSDFTMPKNYCSVSYNNTFFLSPCGNSQVCDIPTGQCQKPSPTPASLQYPGEPCTHSSDCSSNTCVNSICKGLESNSTCYSHDQCDPGLRCYQEKCQKQLDLTDSNCFSDFDCINSAGCNYPKSSITGTCTAYFSLPVKHLVSDCINGVSYLCKSSECLNINNLGNYGYCKSSFVSIKALPVSCTNSNDCKGTDGVSNEYSSCVCGYNDKGNSYCEAFSGDLPGLEYFDAWQKALVATLGRCNTERRFEPDCLKAVGQFEVVLRANWKYRYYPLVQNNDDCVKEMITYEAYQMESFITAFALASFYLIV